METKLTLRVDGALVDRAKAEARKRGTSVSKMVASYFRSFQGRGNDPSPPLPPGTSSLLGSLRGKKLGVDDYRKHLEQKHL